MRRIDLIKSILVVLLIPIVLNCSLQKKQRNKLESGEAIVKHLDSLFGVLSNTNSNTKDFQETIVSVNENIRQAIEHNITSPRIVSEINSYYSKGKHDFSFAQSADKGFTVFSWNTRKLDYPIKSIGFYVSENRTIPTSLFGKPLRYDQIEIIENRSGIHTYILGGLANPSNHPNQYQLSAYRVLKDGIEEAKVFPSGESAVMVRCSEKDSTTCLGNVPAKSLYKAIAQESLAYTNGEYVLN
ncbi:hypothetical protein AB1A65_11930 [Muricauda sp. ANG21]|uniref:hypothetical protein n=1 Tax=Allomuricauda sp. ANG21 TaxID=3042468 RepID=UPI0034568FE0